MINHVCWISFWSLCLFSILIYIVEINSQTAAPQNCSLLYDRRVASLNSSWLLTQYFKYMNPWLIKKDTRKNVSKMAEKFRRLPCGYFKSEYHKLEPSRHRRIIGGRVISFEYPWSVILIDFQAVDTCTGSLISHDWVLTAAHCLQQKQIDMVLVLRNSEYIKVAEMVAHPDFLKEIFHADIGLVKLQRSVCLSDDLRPVCLPFVYADYTDRSSKCSISGYGKQAVPYHPIYGVTHPSPIFFRELPLNVIAGNVCMYYQRLAAAKKPITNVSPYVYCAFPNNSRDEGVCSGDSGGPLNCKVKDKYVVAGVVSASQFDCLSYNLPAIFTCVNCFLDWILSNVDFEKPNGTVCRTT